MVDDAVIQDIFDLLDNKRTGTVGFDEARNIGEVFLAFAAAPVGIAPRLHLPAKRVLQAGHPHGDAVDVGPV